MNPGIITVSYIIATILFILALGGLSHQETARRGNWYGIVGMALAVVATLIGPGSGLWLLSLVLIAAGGAMCQVLTRARFNRAVFRDTAELTGARGPREFPGPSHGAPERVR